MRVGDNVKRILEVDKMEQYVLGEEEGVVIGIDTDCHGHTSKITVRWQNGRVTEHGEDENEDFPLWELHETTPEVYVNVYLWDRVYTGPEEGGQYCDVYSIGDTHLMETPEAALEFAEKLQKEYDVENKSRQHPSSVLHEGWFIVKVEAWPGESYPKVLPRYE